MGLDRKVTLEIDLEASKAQRAARELQDQIGGIGKAGTSIEVINRNLLEMTNRFQQTGLISTRAIAAVGLELKNAEKNFSQLTASQQQFLTAARDRYRDLISSQREFNQELQKVQRQTRDWTGFQNSLAAISGRFGSVLRDVIAVTAAFSAGWEAGRRLDDWLEHNISGWKRWRDSVAESIVGAQHELTRLTDDPRFAGTRTEKLLPEIIAKQAQGKRLFEAAGKDLVDYGATLMRAYYENNLKLYHDNAARALKAQEDYIKRSNDLWKAQGRGFAGFVDQFGVSNEQMTSLRVSGIFDAATKFLDDPEVKKKVEDAAAKAAKLQHDAIVEAAEEQKQLIIEAGEALSDALREAGSFVADALTDFGLTGGKNFGSMLQSYIAKGTQQGYMQLFQQGGAISSLFSGAFGPNGLDVSGYWNAQAGAYINPQTGAPFQGDTPQQQRLAAQSQQLNKYISGSLQAAGAIYNSLTNGSTNDLGGFAQDAVTYAGLGAQLGGGIGALVGVIVAGIVQAFKPSMVDVADFATYNVRKGTAWYRENTKSDEYSLVVQRKVQDAVDSTFNAFTSVILRFPAELLSKLVIPITGVGVSGGKWDEAAGGKITGYGKSDFKMAMDDFNAWLAGTLPIDIAEAFKPALEQGFKALGLTNTAFERYWEKMKGVDPQKAQQFWSDLVDFLNTWTELQASMANVNAATLGKVASWNLNPDGSQRLPGQSDYIQALSQAEERIRDLAAAVATLTGPDQIAAAKQLGDTVSTVMQSLVDYMNLLGTTARAIQEDIRSRLLSLDLDQAKGDKQRQQDLLYAEYRRIDEEIKNAARLGLSPDQLRSDVSQAANLAGQIYGLAPDAAHAGWYRTQLEQLQKDSSAQLEAMAEIAKTEVEKLIAQVKPFVDYVSGIPLDLDPAFKAAEDSLVSFSQALDILTGRITNDVNNSPGGSSGAHPGNWVWDDTQHKWVPPTGPPNDLGGLTGITAASRVVGELRIYVNDVQSGAVDLRSEGFARRTVIARGRR